MSSSWVVGQVKRFFSLVYAWRGRENLRERKHGKNLGYIKCLAMLHGHRGGEGGHGDDDDDDDGDVRLYSLPRTC